MGIFIWRREYQRTKEGLMKTEAEIGIKQWPKQPPDKRKIRRDLHESVWWYGVCVGGGRGGA